MSSFGLRAFLGAVPPTDLFRFDQLLVGLFLSPVALGLYVAALAFTNLPRFLSVTLGMVIYPNIAAEPSARRTRESIWNYTMIIAVLSIAVSAPIALLAGPALSLFFGSDFEPAATTLQVLLLGSVLLATRRVLGEGLRGAGQPGASSWAEVISWAWMLPAAFVAADLWGMIGVAGALTSTYAISLAVLWVLAERVGLGLIHRDGHKESARPDSLEAPRLT
jgi:O-antigen/teichoic acid export membrane protein